MWLTVFRIVWFQSIDGFHCNTARPSTPNQHRCQQQQITWRVTYWLVQEGSAWPSRGSPTAEGVLGAGRRHLPLHSAVRVSCSHAFLPQGYTGPVEDAAHHRKQLLSQWWPSSGGQLGTQSCLALMRAQARGRCEALKWTHALLRLEGRKSWARYDTGFRAGNETPSCWLTEGSESHKGMWRYMRLKSQAIRLPLGQL